MGASPSSFRGGQGRISSVRLGVNSMNAVYVPSLLKCFEYPQSLGIMGGKVRSSLYFVGYQDERLLYLDPHTVQDALLTSRRVPQQVTALFQV